jgi:hypothetical protein
MLLLLAGSLISSFCFGQATSIPATIRFERQVIQQTNGESGKGTITYYFTLNGDYALAKREATSEDEKATVLYTKEGQMCMIDEKNKTIMMLNMPKMIGEGAQMGKELAEKIKKQPKRKDDAEKMTVTKTGKTKTICGYPAFEYEIKNEKGQSSWWYVKADFNPVKIYTAGAGNSSLSAKMKGNEESLKNNPMAIPVLNQNYLMAEIEAGGRKGLETTSIAATTFSFSTAGYQIKDLIEHH